MALRDALCRIFGCAAFVSLDGKVDDALTRVTNVEGNMGNLETQMGDVDSKMDGVVTDMATVVAESQNTQAQVNQMAGQVGGMAATIGILMTMVACLMQNPQSIWVDLPDLSNLQQNDTLSIPVSIKGDLLLEIRAFGLEVAFDPAIFQFNSVQAGSLTSAWNTVDGNEGSPGVVIVGGFPGSAQPIKGAVIGELFFINFTVLVSPPVTSLITLQNYVDDIADYQPGLVPIDVAF